ncbi:uncharacterized protein [Montipora capricornis]|uniref:uncharacterized protein isoform X2 n=1 Tax=Montipora capricornis TaxID=246305 RepID=UPI0035F1664B
MESTSKLRVVLLASEWGSKRSRLSTFNRELAIQLAKCPEVKVSVLVPRYDQEERKAAHNNKVSIIQAKEMTGFEETDWLSFPPDDLQIDFVVGHGVELGRHAQVIRHKRQCKWIQFVHTDPEELGMLKDDSDAIYKAERQRQVEVDLCVEADCVVAVGHKLAEAYRSSLRFCEKDQDVFVLTPGIFSEFFNVVQGKQDGNKCRVLAFGLGDSEDFSLKGFDIAAGALGKLDDAICIFVGAQDRHQDEVADRTRERLKQQFSEVDIAILPSRSEGFGLAALEALSAGLPVLVSDNSGFGKALQEVRFGSHYVVSSEDAVLWAKKINEIWARNRETRLEEAKDLRENYGKKYIWEEQCKGLVERMKKVLDGCQTSIIVVWFCIGCLYFFR